MSHRELEQRRKEATPRGIGVLCDFYAVRAENATLWDEQGREYIDFTAGIATLNIGHRHPKVMAAVRQQLDQFTHTAYQVVPYASYVTLAEKINSLAPISDSNMTAAGNSKTAFFHHWGRSDRKCRENSACGDWPPWCDCFLRGISWPNLIGDGVDR